MFKYIKHDHNHLSNCSLSFQPLIHSYAIKSALAVHEHLIPTYICGSYTENGSLSAHVLTILYTFSFIPGTSHLPTISSLFTSPAPALASPSQITLFLTLNNIHSTSSRISSFFPCVVFIFYFAMTIYPYHTTLLQSLLSSATL